MGVPLPESMMLTAQGRIGAPWQLSEGGAALFSGHGPLAAVWAHVGTRRYAQRCSSTRRSSSVYRLH